MTTSMKTESASASGVISVEKYPRRKTYIDSIRMNKVVYDEVKAGEDLEIDR